MGHVARLQWVARVTYYLGWIALVCGGLVHINIAQSLFLAINLSQRNLFEACVVSFVICIASAVRALVPAENEMPSIVKKAS